MTDNCTDANQNQTNMRLKCAKTITIKAGNSLPGDIKEYITENLSEEEYKEIQLNLDEAKSKINVPGEYAYYIVYKNSRYFCDYTYEQAKKILGEIEDDIIVVTTFDEQKHFEERDGKEYPFIGNYHTHGLDRYGQKELCIVLNLPYETACGILNTMGQRVKDEETIFTEGIRTDVLKNEMDVELLAFDDDPVLYIIFPDTDGKLPMDDDCKEPYKFQHDYATLLHNDALENEKG